MAAIYSRNLSGAHTRATRSSGARERSRIVLAPAPAVRYPGLSGVGMVQRVATVAFEGVEARSVDVQVQVAAGMPAFQIVGLADKAVSEARERVRSALIASGLALPVRRITINLAPADLPKEGSHYDLPIALGLMAAIGAIPPDALDGYTVLGELGLDGSIAAVAGVLPAAIGANARGDGLICPARCGPAPRRCSTRCVSRSRPARSRSRGPTTASPTRRASCWSPP